MDRRPTRWHSPPPQPRGAGRRGGRGGPGRPGHVIVLLFILAGLLALGLGAPLGWLEAVLGHFGFR